MPALATMVQGVNNILYHFDMDDFHYSIIEELATEEAVTAKGCQIISITVHKGPKPKPSARCYPYHPNPDDSDQPSMIVSHVNNLSDHEYYAFKNWWESSPVPDDDDFLDSIDQVIRLEDGLIISALGPLIMLETRSLVSVAQMADVVMDVRHLLSSLIAISEISHMHKLDLLRLELSQEPNLEPR